MKVAFIGASHWHLPLYLDPFLALPDAEVVGISDPDGAYVSKVSARLGCAGDTDFRELCRRTRPDFVFALGRHVDMPDEARFLIEEGIPFAIEKPCGVTQRDVATLAELARARGAFAAVPLVFRDGDLTPLLEAEAARGEGVQTMSFRFIAGYPARYLDAGCGWMLDPALSGGGCTINLAVHFLDLALTLLGADVEVSQATMSNASWGHAVEDYSAVTLRSGNRTCLVETGYLYPGPTSTFDMHFAVRTRERYIIAHDPRTVEVLDHAGNSERLAIGTTNVPNYARFVADVLERARTGRAPLATLQDMVPVMGLVDSAYAKARFEERTGPRSQT
ncbi:MAG: Oxidoreductase domain protein [Enterovirga sp.]|nr:Oxidoreductase domain protein [Enterovirga sp.]